MNLFIPPTIILSSLNDRYVYLEHEELVISKNREFMEEFVYKFPYDIVDSEFIINMWNENMCLGEFMKYFAFHGITIAGHHNDV